MLKIRIETNNAAFVDGCKYKCLELEVCACLAGVIQKIEQGNTEGSIHDTNGNNVGNFTLTNR